MGPRDCPTRRVSSLDGLCVCPPHLMGRKVGDEVRTLKTHQTPILRLDGNRRTSLDSRGNYEHSFPSRISCGAGGPKTPVDERTPGTQSRLTTSRCPVLTGLQILSATHLLGPDHSLVPHHLLSCNRSPEYTLVSVQRIEKIRSQSSRHFIPITVSPE